MKLRSMGRWVTRVLSSGLLLAHAAVLASDALNEIHQVIVQKYTVEHIDGDALSADLRHDNIILFDVREREEYNVSHLDNAIQLDPQMGVEKFLELHADKLDNKIVVFYCSVGERSSRMLQSLQDDLHDSGAAAAFNLAGGAFKWHNEQRSLVKNGLSTRGIHPYNLYWGRLINDKDAIQYR